VFTDKDTLVLSSLSVILLAGVIVGLVQVSSPHYNKPWCASVESTIDAHQQTEGQYKAALASEGLPCAKFLADLYEHDAAYANEQSANDYNVLGAIGGRSASSEPSAATCNGSTANAVSPHRWRTIRASERPQPRGLTPH